MEWRVIEDFPDYSVSNEGDIRRDSTGRILAYKVNQYEVVYVGMMRGYKQYQRSIALLVAKAFLPQPFPAMDTPIHMDGDRHNNHVDNLRWRPRWFAVLYNRQFKEPYPNPILKRLRKAETGEEYENSHHAAIANGLLERDVVLSILNNTVTWPTYETFEVVE